MKSVAALTVSALALATLPGCIIVATDRYDRPHHATKAELAAVRQIEASDRPPSIRSEYREQLTRLAPGMSVASFKEAFPQAIFVSEREDSGHKLDAYSVKVSEPYYRRGDDVIQTAHDEAWFYFKDSGFVKWGEPNEWP